MKHYCLGFVFQMKLKHVLLIHKTHPKWQKDKFNGIGGRVEKEEKPIEAMRREFKEEVGRFIPLYMWNNPGHFDTKSQQGPARVHLFSAVINDCIDNIPIVGKSDEYVEWFRVDNILRYRNDVIPNVPMLMHLCLAFYLSPSFKEIGKLTYRYGQ